MSCNNIDYNNQLPEFEGLKLYVDAFNKRRRISQVMPIFLEEQPLTWMLYEKEIHEFLSGRKEVKILDVGCGSGFWGLLLKHKFPQAEVVCLDKNPEAIERTHINACLNNLTINLVTSLYQEESFSPESFDLIVLTPPYHLYDPKNSNDIPLFARGGDYGLQEFYSQSDIAYKHLKSDGMILFNQMSAGTNDGPDYIRYYEKFGRGKLSYTDILGKIETETFLKILYGSITDNAYFSDFISKMPELYYTSGIYHKGDDRFCCQENSESKSGILDGLSEKYGINIDWVTRIDLHRQINLFRAEQTDLFKVSESLPGINFFKAISDYSNDCFTLSGSDLILNFLIEKLGNVPMMIDFSAIPSSLLKGELADFITIFDPQKSFFVEQDSLDNAYDTVYGELLEKNLGLFYHPDFFHNPSRPNYYNSSNQEELDPSQIPPKKDDKQNPWYNVQSKINPKLKCLFKNETFSLQYEKFIQKIESGNNGADCQKRCDSILQYYNTFFKKPDIDVQDTHLIAIPIIAFTGTDNGKQYEGQGAIFVYFQKPGFNDNEIDSIASGLLTLCLEITYNSIFRIATELGKKATSEAAKSAKAAIMSRNMSHNLGSHVMAYLKQKLSNVTDILKDGKGVLYNLPEKIDVNGLKGIELPFLVGLGRFIGYLQERQDFIATIATDYIPYGAPVNLKDAIYDELNPDLRYIRHQGDGQDRPFNILLNNIAKSEGLSRENMEFDGNGVINTKNDIIFGFVHYYYNDKGEVVKHVFGIDRTDSKDTALQKMRKINFSLPGGLVGRQAIFSIFENLIRNAAKHCRTSNNDNLEFILDVIDGARLNEEKVLQLGNRICDKEWIRLYKSADDISSLFILSITDNRVQDSRIVGKIREALYEPFVDDEGKMTTANKGIKEIRISAAWIRGDVEENNYYKYKDEIDNAKRKHAPIVAVEQDSEGHLRYLICIKKNKLVAVIKEGLKGDVAKEDLHDNDAKFFDTLSQKVNSNDWTFFEDVREYKERSAKNDSFSYIVVANDEIFKKIRPISSNRVCIWSATDDERTNLAQDCTGERTLMKITQTFTGLGDGSPSIAIWDGKTSSKNHFGKIHVSSSETNTDKERYVYLTHLSNEKEFKEYWKKKHNGDYRQIEFIEGITGSNSTDRLVRHEQLNEHWYYSHLYAMKKKVAIIDERLFKYVHEVDENKFVTGSKEISKAISDLRNDCDISSVKDDLYNLNFISLDDCATISDIEERERLIDFLKGFEQEFKVISTNHHMSAVYSEKGVDVFTFIPDEKGNLALVGCLSNEYSNDDKVCKNKFGKIAVFSNGNGSIKLTPCEKGFASKYDYISIHQGILDKIYEFYIGKEDKESNEDNSAEEEKKQKEKVRKIKLEVTSQIDCLLSRNSPIYDFKPNFIIHSGRAKPAEEDMPQKFPFVQYAAIENAVKDCKYSLIELLDFARYE